LIFHGFAQKFRQRRTGPDRQSLPPDRQILPHGANLQGIVTMAALTMAPSWTGVAEAGRMVAARGWRFVRRQVTNRAHRRHNGL
jgi:hypothetical protein